MAWWNRDKKTPAPVQQVQQERYDSYADLMLRIGTNPRAQQAIARLLTDIELEQTYIASPIAKRIVDVIPEEMFRAGFTVVGIEDQDDFKSQWDELQLTPALIQLYIWSRLYGGAALLLGVGDGSSDMLTPLGGGEMDFHRVLAPVEMSPAEVVGPTNPDPTLMGMPEYWMVNTLNGTGQFGVHHSRLIIVTGSPLPPSMRSQSRYFGMSVLQGITDTISDFEIAHATSTSLLERLQQGVWGVNNLSDMCETGPGQAAVQRRLELVDGTRSVNNTIAIDALTETYTLLNGSLGGVTDLLKEKKNKLSLATGIHASILTGENVAGLNSAGGLALESFHKLVGRWQEYKGTPVVSQLVNMIIPGAEEYRIEWNPLTDVDDATMADVLLKVSQANDYNIQNQSIDVDEARDKLTAMGLYKLAKGPYAPQKQTTSVAPTAGD